MDPISNNAARGVRGRTNILETYRNKDITLTLPDDKNLADIKWLAVYDLTVQVKPPPAASTKPGHGLSPD